MDPLHFEGTTMGRTSRWPQRVSCGTPASPPPAHMRASTRRRAGYGRYDESTATRLGRMPEQLLADYGGDLRRLRAAGHTEPAALSRLLRDFPGIGPAGAQIFLRELRGIWSLPPVFDAKALEGARRAGLPAEPEALAALVAPADRARFVAALVRRAPRAARCGSSPGREGSGRQAAPLPCAEK